MTFQGKKNKRRKLVEKLVQLRFQLQEIKVRFFDCEKSVHIHVTKAGKVDTLRESNHRPFLVGDNVIIHYTTRP